jgi:DNA-binding NtrC family response regulator
VTDLPATDLWSENRRRSKRIKARVPVVVRFQDSNKRFVSETTHTVIVNEHGALILLAASVEVNMIEAALSESGGQVSGPSGAAAKLGLPGSTLESKIRSLKIDKNRFKTSPGI